MPSYTPLPTPQGMYAMAADVDPVYAAALGGDYQHMAAPYYVAAKCQQTVVDKTADPLRAVVVKVEKGAVFYCRHEHCRQIKANNKNKAWANFATRIKKEDEEKQRQSAINHKLYGHVRNEIRETYKKTGSTGSSTWPAAAAAALSTKVNP
ncbi:hypothetical protein ACEQ8H_005405 [Pleosporales sp. CAS-2024a]